VLTEDTAHTTNSHPPVSTTQVALQNGLDLQQIVNRPDPTFFIERVVKIGTAYRFIDDIEWVERRRELIGSSDAE
jgi:hypothetical protein